MSFDIDTLSLVLAHGPRGMDVNAERVCIIWRKWVHELRDGWLAARLCRDSSSFGKTVHPEPSFHRIVGLSRLVCVQPEPNPLPPMFLSLSTFEPTSPTYDPTSPTYA